MKPEEITELLNSMRRISIGEMRKRLAKIKNPIVIEALKKLYGEQSK